LLEQPDKKNLNKVALFVLDEGGEEVVILEAIVIVDLSFQHRF